MTLKRRLDRLMGDLPARAAAARDGYLSDADLLAEIQALLNTAGARGGLPVPRVTMADLPDIRAALAVQDAEKAI